MWMARSTSLTWRMLPLLSAYVQSGAIYINHQTGSKLQGNPAASDSECPYLASRRLRRTCPVPAVASSRRAAPSPVDCSTITCAQPWRIPPACALAASAGSFHRGIPNRCSPATPAARSGSTEPVSWTLSCCGLTHYQQAANVQGRRSAARSCTCSRFFRAPTRTLRCSASGSLASKC